MSVEDGLQALDVQSECWFRNGSIQFVSFHSIRTTMQTYSTWEVHGNRGPDSLHDFARHVTGRYIPKGLTRIDSDDSIDAITMKYGRSEVQDLQVPSIRHGNEDVLIGSQHEGDTLRIWTRT